MLADANKVVPQGTITSESQQFHAIAPRYNLPADAVSSVNPPPGASAPVTVLPHIVFKDPHFPWQRVPTFVDNSREDGDTHNPTTWTLLLAFSPEELKLDNDKLAEILHDLPGVKAEQTETMAVRMLVREAQQLEKVANSITFDDKNDAHDAESTTDVVFLEKDLFMSLFTDPPTKSGLIDSSQYKYLAHVRKAATDGMVDDRVEGDSSLCSVVTSPRTGRLDAKAPVTTIVHLISLCAREGFSVPSDTDRVALISLHSWTYNCIPSGGDAGLKERLGQLGANLTVIRPEMPDEQNQVPSKTQGQDTVEDKINRRRDDGYTVVKYRTVTGETTAAITRGPFVPKLVPQPLPDKFKIQSNFGSDLQILDPDLSLMDITYSAAWQLGKTLAMGDEAFSASLARLRSIIYRQAHGAFKTEVVKAPGRYQSRADTTKKMLDLVKSLNGLNDSEALPNAVSTDGTLHNEPEVPENAEFEYINTWVVDKLHLADVPAQYLVPDPSYLPQETLRIFYLDHKWTDALVDGALSLANHWGATPEADFGRTAIKKAIQNRLARSNSSFGGRHTHIPECGFIIRSQMLVEIPDITVSVQYTGSKKTGGEIKTSATPSFIQKRLSDDTIYCLLDCKLPDVRSIMFTTPPRQIRFTIGEDITDKQLVVAVKETFPDSDLAKQHNKRDKEPAKTIVFNMETGEIFDRASHTLKVKPY
ncbi:hypothetical protein BR93DRAFT_391795 [Coniochaeta sp. PMI_546]|nr:hypothetical protein BR93DRAFT_391795 [Coniochaeta sp. PMI_546]